jgi:PilZ domain
MLQDRRKTQRQIANAGAKIISYDSRIQDCVIADISEGGVRILTEDTDVPDEFVLFFNDGNGARRKCRVVWRLDNEIGVEFIEA